MFWFLCIPNTSLSALPSFLISSLNGHEKWYTYLIICKHIYKINNSMNYSKTHIAKETENRLWNEINE